MGKGTMTATYNIGWGWVEVFWSTLCVKYAGDEVE